MSNPHPTKGFTLVEFLIVIALIGILSTLTVFALRSARQKTRDAERLSAVSQIRANLGLAFAELASYPMQTGNDLVLGGTGSRVLCEVSGVPKFAGTSGDCTGTVFMPAVPAAPTPDDGVCTATQNTYRYKAGSGGADYRFEFCLGKAPGQSDLRDGLNCATPEGLVPGACR